MLAGAAADAGGGAGGVLGGEAGGDAGSWSASLRKEGRKHARKHETHESSDAFPTGEVTRRDDSASASDFSSAYAVASSPSGALGWRPSTRWPSDDDGERFFADPRWRRQPAPLDAQKEYLDAHFHRCGERQAFLSVPRFQNTKDLLYTGWAPLRMCEAMGGDETRVVAMLTNPIDHAASVFAETLLQHRDAVAGWATPAKAEPKKKRENISYSGAASSSRCDAADLHIARVRRADGLLLGTSDARFEAKARRCASAAAGERARGVARDAPAGARDGGPLRGRARATSAAAGLLAGARRRVGGHLRRLYERVPAQNVMVVTADQARRSGLPHAAP